MAIDDHDRNAESEEHLEALECRLAAWRPGSGALDRDRMLYDAGRSAARADSQIQAWRVATVALLALTIGLSGLLARQNSLLKRERSSLASEQAERRRMQTTTISIGSGVPAGPSRRPVESAAALPFAPASYFALTSRLVASGVDPSWPEAEDAAGSHRRDPGRSAEAPTPTPLRPRDVQRVLEL